MGIIDHVARNLKGLSRRAPAGTDMLRAALWYAKRGWAVLPLHAPTATGCSCGAPSCRSAGKHPRISNGVKGATTNPEQVRRWWAEWPDANVGIATGRVSGLVALDVDGQEAEEAVAELCGDARTPRSLTGKGYHLLFVAPGDPLRNAVRLAPSLDLRADGGYIVAPPSLHASGRRYRWDKDTGRTPWQLELASLPTGVEKVSRNGGRAHPATVLAPGASVPEGQRNDFLTCQAGRLLAKGYPDAEALELCQSLNLRTCSPPLPEAEVAAIVASIAAREAAKRDAADSILIQTWPEPPAREAFSGLAGELVGLISENSEADPVALLAQLLTAFGNCIGRGPHFAVEADRHALNLFTLLIGATSKARKGSSWGQIKRLFDHADPEWAAEHILSGLSSGEGVIFQVRDPIERQEKVREGGRVTGYQTVTEDPGVSDKRLLILEPEFSSALRVMAREGNILSPVLRQAWDSGDLRTLTKNSPAKATGSHVSVVGHITGDELRRLLDRTEIANGFLNRFLIVCARRSQLLPEGGNLGEPEICEAATALGHALAFARCAQALTRDDEARAVWHEQYRELSSGRPGLLGAVTSRAEAQVMRLACLYALLDQRSAVSVGHLRAALALWRYCEDSARFVFGDTLGDPVAEELLQALRASADGLTRTEIRDHFSGHQVQQVHRALAALSAYGLVSRMRDGSSGGRPAERWMATEATKAPAGVAGRELRSLPSRASTGTAPDQDRSS